MRDPGNLDRTTTRRSARRNRQVEEETPPPPSRRFPTWGVLYLHWQNNMMVRNAVFGAIFTVLLVLAVRALMPAWVDRRLMENLGLLLLAVVLLVATAIYLPSKIPFAAIAARWLRVVGVVVLITFIFLPSGYARKKIEDVRKATADRFVLWLEGKSSNGGTTTRTTSTNNIVLPVSEEGCKMVMAFWEERKPSHAKALTLYSRLESGCNQYRPGGSVYRNANSTAMGIMQVLESKHKDKAKELGLDLNKTEGNMLYSDWLVSERIRKGEPFDEDWAETRDKVMALLGATPDAQNASLDEAVSSKAERTETFTLSPEETTGWVEDIGGRLSHILLTKGGGQIAIADTAGYHVIVVPEIVDGKPARIPLDVYRGGRVTVLNANDESGGEPGLEITFEIRRW